MAKIVKRINWVKISEQKLIKVLKCVEDVAESYEIELEYKNGNEERFTSTGDLAIYLASIDFDGYNKIKHIRAATGYKSSPNARLSMDFKDVLGTAILLVIESESRDDAKMFSVKITDYFSKSKTKNFLVGGFFGSFLWSAIIAGLFATLIINIFLYSIFHIKDYFLIYALVIALYIPTLAIISSQYKRLTIIEEGGRPLNGRLAERDWVSLCSIIIIPIIVNLLTK